jgi:hypothetical protein
MDYKYEKEQLEMYKKTLENSIKMYETTLEQMAEKGSSKETMSFVLQMKRDTENSLNDANLLLNKLEKGEKTNFVIAFNELMEKMKTYSPYTRNRFVVSFGTEDIQGYYVEGVSYDEKLIVTFRNSEQFFVPEYFEKNKHFDKVNLFLLSPLGEKKAVVEFSDVEVELMSMDDFTYEENDVLKTKICFSYKNIAHKTL